MKPTEKQQKVIELIIDQLESWKCSNDIHSASHFCEIDNINLDYLTNEYRTKKIQNIVHNLYEAICFCE